MLQEEVTQLVSEINRSAESVKFNGLKLMTGYLDWNEWQENVALQNVEDCGLIGTANYGFYNVDLNVEAKAQVQTSAVKTGTFVTNQALTTDTNTIANTTVATAKYSYTSSAWQADFSASNIEIMNSITANGTTLTEGTDYTYTDGTSGADEGAGKINLIANANTTKTINNEAATLNATSDNNVIKVTNVITNWNIGDTLTVTDALVDSTTTGTQSASTGGITYSFDTETSGGAVTGTGNFEYADSKRKSK